jgi:hypothetical protein
MVQIDNVPSELKTKKCWVGFELVWDDGRQKYSKVPKIATNGSNASSTDPSTWCSFEEAKAGPWDVVGISLIGDGILGVDIDHRIDFELIKRFGSYAERSPSGEGTRILVKGKLPENAKNKNGNNEIYAHSRCMTITGDVLYDGPIIENQEAVNYFVEHYIGYRTSSADADHVDFEPEELSKSDIDSLDAKLQTVQAFYDLANGNWEDVYSSQSEADYALCCHMVRALGNAPGKIETALKMTKAVREKWDESRGDTTYLRQTIMQAIADVEDQGEMPEIIEEEKQPSLREKIEAYVEEAPGMFYVNQMDQELGISQKDKGNRSVILNRLEKEGKVARGNIRGQWRVRNKEKQVMNFSKIDRTEVSLPLPFNLNEHYKIKPGNVIIVAGATNGGKTAFVLNLIHSILNQRAAKVADALGMKAERHTALSKNYVLFNPQQQGFDADSISVSELLNKQLNKKSGKIKVCYMNAEGTEEEEFEERLDAFPGGLESFIEHDNFEMIKRSEDFEDIIEPGTITIVDYLQMFDNFYNVGQKIKNMKDSIGKGLLIVCVQKKNSKDKLYGRGGEFGLEQARLGVSLDSNKPYGHIITVTKGKNVRKGKDIEGMSMDYKLEEDGSKIVPVTDWRYVKSSKERDKINKDYELDDTDYIPETVNECKNENLRALV